MSRKFKNGQRVQIIRGDGKPTGEIVKYSRNLDTYDIQGDDGYNYNCITSSDIVLLDEDIKFELELKDGEKLQSMIKQFEDAVNETGEVSLTSYQAQELLAEIKFLQTDHRILERENKKLRNK